MDLSLNPKPSFWPGEPVDVTTIVYPFNLELKLSFKVGTYRASWKPCGASGNFLKKYNYTLGFELSINFLIKYQRTPVNAMKQSTIINIFVPEVSWTKALS
jgi:hypothetical protein